MCELKCCFWHAVKYTLISAQPCKGFLVNVAMLKQVSVLWLMLWVTWEGSDRQCKGRDNKFRWN